MPVVPVDQNRVGPSDGVSARYRAPDMSGTGLEAIGRGMQALGQGGDQYAQAQHQIQDHANKIGARDIGLEAQGEYNQTVAEYGQLAGKDATDQGAAYQKRLQDIREKYLQRAGNPAMREYLSGFLGEQTLRANNAVAEHSQRELYTYSKTTYASGVSLAQQSAAQFHNDPTLYAASFNEGLSNLDKLGHLEGWDENTAKLKRLEYTTGIHQTVLDGMKASAVPDVDAIQAYAAKHADEMSLDARNQLTAWLQKPLQDRELDRGVDAAMAGLKASPIVEDHVAYRPPIQGGTVTNTFAQHEARGSAGLDIGASLGSAIHPIASGVVTEVTQDDRAGKWVMVKHPDGTTSSYAHMGNQSVKVGDEVSASTVLGTVGMTGHTTGPHVHLRTRDAQGKDIDPEKLLGTRPAITSASSTARNWDQAQVIANIKAMGLSPEKEQLMIARARQRMGESESLLADQQQDLGQKVHEWVGNWQSSHGGDYPPPTALPSWASGWQGVAELRGSLANAAKAKSDKAVADAQNWTSLQATLRMYNDPQGFLTADVPKEYLGKVSSGDYAQIVTAQARMRQDAAKPQPWNPFGDSKQALDTYLMLNPAKLDDQSKATALQTIKDVASDFVQRKGAPPSDSEWYDIARRAMRKVDVPGTLWGTNSVPVTAVSKVPADARNRIVQSFRSVNRRDPTEDEVLRWYRKTLAQAPQ